MSDFKMPDWWYEPAHEPYHDDRCEAEAEGDWRHWCGCVERLAEDEQAAREERLEAGDD